MKDVLQTYKFNFEFNTKDSKKQLKSISDDVLKMLSDMDSASNKMKIFTNLVGYLEKLDSALNQFKAHHKDDFDNMFGGLDSQLAQSLKSVLGLDVSKLGQLSGLRERIDNALVNKSGVKELRAIAQDINSLFAAIGDREPINIDEWFTGKGKTFEQRISYLNDQLHDFYMSYQLITSSIKGGFGAGGAAGFAVLSEEAKQEAEQIKANIKELNSAGKQLERAKDAIVKIEKKSSKTPAEYKVDLTIESVQSLIAEFDKLNNEIASGDGTSQEYYNNLLKMSDVVIKLKGALKDINANKDIKEMFVGAASGDGSSMFGKLSEYANTKSIHFVQQHLDSNVSQTIKNIIDKYVKDFAGLIPSVTGDDVKIIDHSASKKANAATSQYHQLIAKLNEYREVIEDINFDPDDDVIADKLFDIKNDIREIFNVSKDAKDAFNHLFDSYDEYSIDFSEFKDGLMGLLNVVEPVEGGLSEAQATLKEFLNLADTLKDVEYMSESAVDKNIAKLEDMKSKLIALSEQGDITTADLQKINDAFDATEVHLTSMKYGYGYDNSFHDETDAFNDDTQESIDEMSDGLATVEAKTHGVTSAFQELINYISKSGLTPKTFFESLASGAMLLDEELSSILRSLQLIDTEGNIKFDAVGSGSINSGGMISDQYALISRNKSKYLKYAVASQPKLFEAEKLGASVGTILDIFTDEVNDVMYELQKRVSGVGLNDQNHNLNSLDFLEATDEQIKKLITDLEILRQVGLYVDHNGKNILYDKKDGFSFIDLASKSTWFTAGEDNSVEENLDLFLTSLFGYNANQQGQDFMRRVYSLGGDVLGKNIMPDYLLPDQLDVDDNAESVAEGLHKEEVAHEQNTAAINAENQALKELIALKKKAQSMTWEDFALDESLSASKSTAGIMSLAAQEKFWKKANYDKDIDFHSLSEEDADRVIYRYFTDDERDQWYTAANFGAKSPIENIILANDELRNAALNKLYYIYKKEGDPDERYKDVDDKYGFEDFLNREFTVYRGDSSPVLYGAEQQLSFSFDEFEARRFAAMDPKYVSSTTLIPKNTVGSLATEDYWGEQEVFVPSEKLPYIDYTDKSFSEYYNKLGPKMQQAIDHRFIQLEMDRVENLLGSDVARGIQEVAPFNPELLNQFKQGLYPNKIDLNGELYNDSLAGAYNDLPEIKKKLAAYYASLYAMEPPSITQQFRSKTIGTTGLLSAIMHDPSGVQQHIANLTGESKFNIFGQSADSVNAEADAHKKNVQAIQEEEQAQKALNNLKDGYKDVSDQLYEDMNDETWHQGKFVSMADISKGLSDVYDTDGSLLAQGKYASSTTGEVFDISSLIDSIAQFEQDWHMNLDYVKDYIQKVSDGFKANKIDDQLQEPLKEIDVEVDDDEGDFEFGQNDLGDTKYVVQDYEYAYKNQNQAAQEAINDLAEFYQKYDAIQSKLRGEPIEFLISSETPTLEETQKVVDTFEALQNKIKEINDMPLVETEDDQKRLQELQIEAIGLQNTLRSAMTVSNNSFSYQSTYGLSLMDAIQMSGYINGEDLYSIAKDLEDQLYDKHDSVYNNATPDLKFMLSDDASDSLGQFLLQKAKQLQLEKEIAAEQQQQVNIADQAESSEEITNAQQHLAVEKEITVEKKEQSAIADATDDTPPTHGVDDGVYAAYPPAQDDQKTAAADGTHSPYDPSDEVADLQNLLDTVDAVKQAVDAKTEAFREEGVVVEQTVAKEVAALEKLSGSVNEVKSAVDAKTQAFKDEGAAVDKVAKKEKKALKKKQEQKETQKPQDDGTKNDTDNTSDIQQEAQAHKDNTDAIREEEVAQENANNAKRTAVDILKEYLRNRYATLPDDALDKQANAQINRLLNQTFVDDPSKGYIGKMMLHGSKDDSNVLDPSYYLPEYKALDEVLQLIGYHLDELKPSMTDEKTQWGFSAEIVANSEKVVANMEQARKILFDIGVEPIVDSDQGADTPSTDNGADSSVNVKNIEKVKTQLSGMLNSIRSEFKTTKIDMNLDGLVQPQQDIVDGYLNIVAVLKQLQKTSDVVTDDQIQDAQRLYNVLLKQMKVYKEQNNIGNGKKQTAKKQTYGSGAMSTIAGKYNTIQSKINGNDLLAGSDVLAAKFNEYEASLTRVTKLYNHLKTIDPTDGDKASFKQASAECNNLYRDVENLILAYEKLHNDPNKIGEETLGDDFVNDIDHRKQKLLDYVESTHGARAKIKGFVDAYHGLEYTVDKGNGTFMQAKVTIDNLGTAMVETAGDAQKATSKFGKFVGDVSSKLRELWIYTASRFGVDEIIQQIRKGIQYVREIDSALTELKKVTNETDEVYSRFLQSMSKTASVVGSTVKDLTNSAADWARLGYSLEEAGQLAETTAKLLNVSEFSSVDDATSALVSSLQAFTSEGEDVGRRAEEIVDILNNIGNKYPVATNELADGLATSSAALVAANNSIEEQVAMLAAGNATMQDVSTVASGLKIVAARLRGTTLEMDEDASSAVTNVSKLQAKIKALTADANGGEGIDIINADGSYKSTYEILAEISKIFDKMDDVSQANLLELIAGKNRSSVVAAILQNGDILEDAYADAFNSTGSAQRELETYLESVQGHIDQFNNSVQTMWMNFLNTDAVKWFIHLGDAIIRMVDNVGLLKTVLTTVGAFWFNKNFGDKLFGDIKSTTDNLKELKSAAEQAKAAWKNNPTPENKDVYDKAAKNLQEYEIEFNTDNTSQAAKELKTDVDNVGKSLEQVDETSGEVFEQLSFDLDGAATGAENLADGVQGAEGALQNTGASAQVAGTQMDGAFKKAGTSVAKFKKQLKGMLASMALMYVVSTAFEVIASQVEWASEKIRENSNSWENLNEKYQDATSELANCESEMRSLESELDTTNAQIEELLAKDTLSFVEQEELERLQAVSAELERQLDITETLQGSLQAGASSAAAGAGQAYFGESFSSDKSKSERQEEAAEKGKKFGQGVGLAGGAAIGAKIGSVGNVPGVLVGAVVGGLLGGLFGEFGASAAEGAEYDSEQTVWEAIDVMKTERAKLVKARDDAYEAYAKAPTEDNSAAWQESTAALATYDQTMAQHMNQIAQYYNTIKASWDMASESEKAQAKEWGDMLDMYNIAMGGKDAKANAINRIFGEEADDNLQKVKKELLAMADAGEKIDLKKAFGDDTAAYDAFVQRLYDMGIYVYECEDAFVKMHEAEVEAAQVSFYDTAKEIQGVAQAISGLKNALNEFLETGYVSTDTALALDQWFNIEGLEDLYNEYISTMLSGNASIEDAMDVTSRMADAFLKYHINEGNINDDNKMIYVNQLRALGITNAQEFVEAEMQRAFLDQMKSWAADNSGVFSRIINAIKGTNPETEWPELAKKYGVDPAIAQSVYDNLFELPKQEKILKRTQTKLGDYEAFVQAWLRGQQDYDALRNRYSAEVRTFDPDEWEPIGGQWRPKDALPKETWLHISNEEYMARGRQKQQYDLEKSSIRNRIADLYAKGREQGWLTEAYTIKSPGVDRVIYSGVELVDGVEEQLESDRDAAQAVVDSIDKNLEADFVLDYTLEFGQAPAVNTLSGVTAVLEEYKNVLDVVDEVLFDGQQISEEYYSTLREQLQDVTVGTEDFFDAIDTSNGYMVKNADLLKALVKGSRNAQVSTIRLAKSQSRLEYYKLYKQAQKLTKGTEVTDKATKQYIDSLYEQMDALSRTIAQYSLLEAQLLGAANAYNEIASAQEADAAADYGSKAEELVNILANAFNTAELGTEAARVAIEGLIPPEVFEDAKTLDEAMQKIYDYFTNGTISQLFTIEFDDDGAIKSVEMTRENVQEFTESLFDKDFVNDGENFGKVFQGTWDEFTLNPQIKTLEDFAKAAGLSAEAAFAYLTEMEKYDIGNVFGGGDSLLDQLMGDNTEYGLYKATQEMADANRRVASGDLEFGSEEYQNAQANLQAWEDRSVDHVTEWYNASQELSTKTSEFEQLGKDLAAAWDAYQKAPEGSYEREVAKSAYGQLKTQWEQAAGDLDELMAYMNELGEPTEMIIGVAKEEVQEDLNDIDAQILEITGEKGEKNQVLFDLKAKIDEAGFEGLEGIGITQNADGTWTLPAGVELDENTKQIVDNYLNTLAEQHVINLVGGDELPSTEESLNTIAASLDTVAFILQDIARILDPEYTLRVDMDDAKSDAWTFKGWWDGIQSKSVTLTTSIKDTVSGFFSRLTGGVGVNGTANVNGSAYKNGSWGAPKTETALVGELGPELLVRGNRWTTIGENGAEFTQIKRGDIIFNHKQTADLLSKGYVTGRGKAYASGTAYAFARESGVVGGSTKSLLSNITEKFSKVVEPVVSAVVTPIVNTASAAANTFTRAANTLSTNQSSSGSVNTFDDGTGDDGTGNSDADKEFEEVFDWIEVRLEEIQEDIDLDSARLENKIGHKEQNKTVNDIIANNQKLYDNLIAGQNKYYSYAKTLLDKVPEEYKIAAQDGTIAIETFVGDADEKTLEAIKEYREWVQKGDEAAKKAEETLTEISTLAKTAIDNIATQFDNEASLRTNQTDQLDAYNALLETTYGSESEAIYKKQIEINETNRKELKKQRDAMQKELNKRVESGEIQKYSQDWYDAVNDIAALDTEIINLDADINNFQDSMNEIHWYHFDLLMKQLDAVSEEADNLIDILKTDDVVDEMGNWTDEGITALGLYAQKMEVAEKQAAQYAEQIDYLNSNWRDLGYTEEEYIDKLDELKSGQYDSIKAYNDSKKAIVDLNKERVDAIKEGIQEEIKALEELIDKKKEELDSEKDLYDFQKSVREQSKDIADIERRLAALSGDNSASARAKRAQLEADLAEAKQNLEDTYYDRSISNQKEALDKELENFKEEKDAEIEGWEEYLEDTETVVKDSLDVVQANTETVLNTLRSMGEEYSLNITESLTSPWENGAGAISNYQTQFGDSVSETMELLDALANKYDEVTGDLAQDISEAGDGYVDQVNNNANRYVEANEITKTESGGDAGGTGASTAGMVSSLSGIIRYGDNNNKVKKLQEALNDLGFNCGKADGIFGNKTLSAVKAFQGSSKYGGQISADGVVGPNTKKKFKAAGYAKGSKGVSEDQWALIDELGEELQLVPDGNGRLAYIKKGTGILTHTMTERLMDLAMDPQMMLDQNRPQVGIHPEVHNTQIQIDNSVGNLVHIEHCDQGTLPDVEKIVNKALDKHMQNLNNSLKRFTR